MSRLQYLMAMMLMALSLASCIDEYNAKLPASESELLVVEGNIFSDTRCVFYLSRTYPLGGSSVNIKWENSAKLSVCGSDGSKYSAVQNGNSYIVNVGSLNDAETYWLDIELPDGERYGSEPQYPLRAPAITDLSFAQPREDKDVDIMVSTEPYADGKVQYLRWTFVEDWEVHAPFDPNYEYDPAKNDIVPISEHRNVGWHHALSQGSFVASSSSYVGNTFNGHRIYSIPYEGNKYRLSVWYRTRILQYAMTQEQYEYEETRRQMGYEMGGLFSPLPTELVGNVVNTNGNRKALGNVCCGYPVNAELYIHMTQVDSNRTPSGRVLPSTEIGRRTNQRLYMDGYRVVFYDPSGILETTWANVSYVDVTWGGASLEKPDGWNPPF